MNSVTRTYTIRTFGCQMNEHDSERIAGLLESNGYARAFGVDDADVIVINTCCIREKADNKLYGMLGHLKTVKEARPGTLIAVAGCLAQKDRELIMQRANHVDVVFGTHNVHRAAELLDHASRYGPIVEILEETTRDDWEAFPSALPARREQAHSAWVTIQIGCDNKCTFCIVPSVRGPEISRPFGQLVEEVRQLASTGVSEITLLGQNVNSYGRDLALSRRKVYIDAGSNGGGAAEAGAAKSEGRKVYTDAGSNGVLDDEWWCGSLWPKDRRARPLFADLLRAVGAIPGIHRVRFTSPHPKDMREETIAAMADVPSVCEHLHLPLQSGSDKVLKAMRRGYTAERYLQRLAEARAGVDDLAVSTDIIVGFPGETERDFERTLEVSAEARYDNAFTFIFSPRPGTVAAEWEDKFIPRNIAVERYERLRNVVQRSSRMSNEARVGRVEEVTVEGPSKKDSSLYTGRTRRNTLIHFTAGSHRTLTAGSYAKVRVTQSATNHLLGELLEITSPARIRRRIPVTTA